MLGNALIDEGLHSGRIGCSCVIVRTEIDNKGLVPLRWDKSPDLELWPMRNRHQGLLIRMKNGKCPSAFFFFLRKKKIGALH
jgi:hypothetical protein